MADVMIEINDLNELTGILRRILGRDPLIDEIGEILLLINKFNEKDQDS